MFRSQKTSSSFCVLFQTKLVCGILLEFVFTQFVSSANCFVSQLLSRYIRDLKCKCYIFFGVHNETILVLMPRTISDLNLFDTANNSQVYFSAVLWRYFCVLVKINSEIFSLFYGITCCWGALKPVLHLGGYRQNNVHVRYTLSSEKNFVLVFKYFLRNFRVRYFGDFHRKKIF